MALPRKPKYIVFTILCRVVCALRHRFQDCRPDIRAAETPDRHAALAYMAASSRNSALNNIDDCKLGTQEDNQGSEVGNTILKEMLLMHRCRRAVCASEQVALVAQRNFDQLGEAVVAIRALVLEADRSRFPSPAGRLPIPAGRRADQREGF
jgi:hypothetical protein